MKITKQTLRKLIKEDSVIETLLGFKRAGASAVVTYFADQIDL